MDLRQRCSAYHSNLDRIDGDIPLHMRFGVPISTINEADDKVASE